MNPTPTPTRGPDRAAGLTRTLLTAWVTAVTVTLLAIAVFTSRHWTAQQWASRLLESAIWVYVVGRVWQTSRDNQLRTRNARGRVTSAITGVGAFTIAATHANTFTVDTGDRLLSGTVALSVGLAAGATGWFLARLAPDIPPDTAPHIGRLDLAPTVTAVWVRRVTNPALLIAAAASTVLLLLFRPLTATAITALGITLAVTVTITNIRLIANTHGLTVDFGPWHWPTRHIPLPTIHHATVDTRRPHDVGGWGYRGLPANTTIMIRGGECLVLHLTNGHQLAVTTTDATTAAKLLNTLHAR